jgi:hypothetical protein
MTRVLSEKSLLFSFFPNSELAQSLISEALDQRSKSRPWVNRAHTVVSQRVSIAASPIHQLMR